MTVTTVFYHLEVLGVPCEDDNMDIVWRTIEGVGCDLYPDWQLGVLWTIAESGYMDVLIALYWQAITCVEQSDLRLIESRNSCRS